MDTEAVAERIRSIIRRCQNGLSEFDDDIQRNAERLNMNLEHLARSFSGSFLGYHANIYYRAFAIPSPGDRFDSEWGFGGIDGSATSKNWVEYSYEQAHEAAYSGVDPQFHDHFVRVSDRTASILDESRNTLLTIADVLLEETKTPALERLRTEVKAVQGRISANDIANTLIPRRKVISRDMEAITAGFRIPPHVAIQAETMSLFSPHKGLEDIVENGKNILTYMEIHSMVSTGRGQQGERVFVGHGNSTLWRELKDFLQDRLHLSWEEFNRISPAGEPTSVRLQNMLDGSCFALLVFTADDEHADKSLHPRENVIHEAGLFQGRLGFKKAVVLLEEGCSEFSNIEGLGQIRFPKGRISAAFEEIRKVLERESIV